MNPSLSVQASIFQSEPGESFEGRAWTARWGAMDPIFFANDDFDGALVTMARRRELCTADRSETTPERWANTGSAVAVAPLMSPSLAKRMKLNNGVATWNGEVKVKTKRKRAFPNAVTTLIAENSVYVWRLAFDFWLSFLRPYIYTRVKRKTLRRDSFLSCLFINRCRLFSTCLSS